LELDTLFGPTETVGSLDDLIWPGPLSALAACVVVFAIWGWGQWLARRLIAGGRATAVEESAGFVLVTAMVAVVVHLVGMVGGSDLLTLRAIGLALVVPGVAIGLRVVRQRAKVDSWAPLHAWERGDRLERVGFVCGLFIVIALGLVAIAPPTDSDSLHYHLGVPLQWLRAGSIRPMPYWLHARLSGLGEAMILLGLALGTDVLGAVLNWVGLLLILATLAVWVRSHRNRLNVLLLVTTVPVLTYLGTTQKPQLFPAAAMLTAVVLLRIRRRELTSGVFCLAFGSMAFAVSCKYSFVFSGFIVVWIGLCEARRRRRLRQAMAILISAFLLISGPVFLRNLVFYGDPASPLLERAKSDPDPVLEVFARYLRDFEGRHTLKNLGKLPIVFVVPRSLRRLNTVLGIGVFAIFLAFRGRRTEKTFLLGCFALTALLLMFGQWSARFFLEPYLWMVVAIGREFRRDSRRVLTLALILQGSLTCVILLRGIVTLTPGVIDRDRRNAVMNAYAIDHGLLKWLDGVLPAEAVVTGMSPNHSEVPRRFAASDYFRFLSMTELPEEEKRRRIRSLLDRFAVDSLVVYSPDGVEPFVRLLDPKLAPIGVKEADRLGRNPFAVGVPVQAIIHRYDSGRDFREDSGLR